MQKRNFCSLSARCFSKIYLDGVGSGKVGHVLHAFLHEICGLLFLHASRAGLPASIGAGRVDLVQLRAQLQSNQCKQSRTARERDDWGRADLVVHPDENHCGSQRSSCGVLCVNLRSNSGQIMQLVLASCFSLGEFQQQYLIQIRDTLCEIGNGYIVAILEAELGRLVAGPSNQQPSVR